MQEDDAMLQEAQEMLRQLVELRLQVGAEQFGALAQRMNMPQEVLDIVEQAATQEGGDEAAPIQPSPLSGLVSSSGQPLASNRPSGLVMPDGTPVRPQPESLSMNGTTAPEEDDIESLLEDDDQEAQAQQMFQELLGVRLVIGTANFVTLSERMGMGEEAAQAVEQTASGIEQEIEGRYTDEDEANTVRLLNARMMMGEERFADLAEQVGMPQEMRDGLEDLAHQIEAQQMGDEDEDDSELQA
jgi:hypothetical protein